MIHAYDKQYLDDAMQNLGEAVDYAVNRCGMDADDFMDKFIAGGLAERFGQGSPKYIAGTSGTELVWETVSRCGQQEALPEAVVAYDYSPEYWSGWILAYYQWYTGRSFKTILEQLPMEQILRLYPTLHEAAEEKCIDTFNILFRDDMPPLQLQILRKAMGYSQKTLAEKSGVTLRMIQQYEQRSKDINKASGASLLALSRALGCRMEDLLE